MKLQIEIEQDGAHSKTTSHSPLSNLIDLTCDPVKYDEDRQKIAENLMAMAFGLAPDTEKLVSKFNLKTKSYSPFDDSPEEHESFA